MTGTGVWTSPIRRLAATTAVAALAVGHSWTRGDGGNLVASEPTAVAALAFSQTSRAAAPAGAGGALAARVVDKQKTPGFRLRGRLTRRDAAGAVLVAANIRAFARTQGATSHLIYQVLWPAEHEGYALLFHRDRASLVATGSLVEPTRVVVPLGDATRARRFLDTDLFVDDLIEDFWRWPGQRVVGSAVVDGRTCDILESRAADSSAWPWPIVRSWIDRERATPLRVEKRDAMGQPARQISFTVSSRKDAVVPARLTIEPADGRSLTTFDVSSYERDDSVPLTWFELDAVMSGIRAR